MANILLSQFANYIASATSLTNVKDMPKLKSEDQFKRFVSTQLTGITDDRVLESDTIWKSLLEHDVPNTLYKFLESAAPCLKLNEKEKQNLNDIKFANDNPKEKFQLIQTFLKTLLVNTKHKKDIEDILWEEYLENQKQQHHKSKKADQLVDQHFQQTDADPLKRACGLVWREFLMVLNKFMYDASGGKLSFINMDADDAQGGEENQLQKLWKMQNGTNFPTPAAPPKPPGG